MKKKATIILVLFATLIFGFSFTEKENPAALKLALLKYNGGGDWYANPTSLPNLSKFCN